MGSLSGIKALLIGLASLFVGTGLSAQYLKPSVVVHASGAEGFYFLHTYKMNKDLPLKDPQQLIIDEKGDVIYFRSTPKASDFKLHPNGIMSFFSNDKFFLLDSTMRIFDSVSCLNGIETDPHDFLILPNGHYLLLGRDQQVEDLSQVAIFKGKNIQGSKTARVKASVIQELNAEKEMLMEWRFRSFYKLEDADRHYLQDTQNIDMTHFNSIHLCPDGNILISARYFNEIMKIRVSDMKILWRMGGPYADIKILNDTLPFLGQHDAREIRPGRITLFDNGYAGADRGHAARAVEYEIDTITRTAKLIWSYTYHQGLISEATGNMQRMPNGNTLINYGKVRNGVPNITFVVVDSLKTKLLELNFSDTIGTYRTWGYSSLPLKQARIRSKHSKGTFSLSADIRSERYLWSTGDTTASIRVQKPGVYHVYVSTPDGGFLRSYPYEIKVGRRRKL